MAQVKQVTSEGLHWVREELAESLDRVREFVEDYLEVPTNPLPLQRSLVELHQIRGTLRMIQCDGAALLAEEMKTAVQDLLNDVDTAPEKAFEVLLGATLQLTDYLDVLAGGERDNALVFLPLINELRVARGTGVFSESGLFARYAQLEMPVETRASQIDDKTVRALAGRHLPAFNEALLQILKDRAPAENLERLAGIAEEMREAVGDNRGGRVFEAAAALLEALRDEGMGLYLEIKRLLGRVGRFLKEVAESGADAFDEVSSDLLYELVYFAGNAESGGERVTALRHGYRLDELLPDPDALERLRARLRGPNTGLVAKLSTAIKEDIESVKSSIDLIVRAGERAPVRIEETVATTRRIGDTLAMLGLEMFQRAVLNQVRAIESLAEEGVRDQDAWMDVALALLRVEESLDNALLRHMRGDEEGVDPEASTRPHREIDAAAAAVYREALVNLSRIKTLLPDFIDGGDPAILTEASRLLRESAAGLRLIEKDEGAALLERLREFVASRAMLDARTEPVRMVALADVVAGVEYYLEALQAGQPYPRAAYEHAARCTESLELAPDEAEPIVVEEPEKVSGMPGETAKPEDVDPEIREVFLEEAAEVLKTLRRDVPAWSGNLDDFERLTDIRRAFHTLKGSGRMAGAGDIGGFGWAVERLLNRCLEGAVEVNAEVAATVQKAVAALPGLIEDFQAGRPPSGITRIVAEANRLAGVTGEADDEDRQTGQYAESELLRIFRNDARGHIERLREIVDDASGRPVSDDTVRALHTLKGGAEAVHLYDFARLAQALEEYADACKAAQQPFSTEDLGLLDEAVSSFEAAIVALEEGSEPDNQAFEALVERVGAIKAELPSDAVESASGHDLRVVFTDEACDLVDALHAALVDWGRNPADVHHPSALKGICHKLKGSARTAEAHELGEVAQALEQRVTDYITDDAIVPDVAELDRLESVIDGLYEMLDEFRQHGRTGESAPIIARLDHPAAEQAPGEDAAARSAASSPGAPSTKHAAEPDAVPAEPGPPGTAPPKVPPEEAADPELLALFGNEAGELMEVFEADLDRWAARPDDTAPREALMRTLHTLKGSARMARITTLGDVCHAIETRLSTVDRAGPDLIQQLRRAADGIYRVIDDIERGETAPSAGTLPAELGIDEDETPAATEPEKAADETEIEAEAAEETEVEPEAGAGEETTEAAAETETEDEAESETETESPAEADAEIVDETEAEPADETPVPAPVEFDERLFRRDEAGEDESQPGLPETARVPVARLDEMLNEAGEISIYRARLAQQNVDFQFQLREMLQTANRLREQLRKLDIETEAHIITGHESAPHRYEAEFDPLEMDRYSALNELSRGLAESATDLMSLHGSLSELAEQGESLLVRQARVNTNLQQGLMRTLMVPFSRQAQRLQRIVRQVGEEREREVRLNLKGAEAELDRNVLEHIVAPLEHLLRNAVVHGIEPPAERAERGKPETGAVDVRLFREGTQLVVEVTDDGRGLDFDAIRDKAVERGLLDSGTEIAGADLAQFIFEPGFSTARELTQTAGRGVGMDVVNAEIKQLGGTLTVDSGAGEGTCFTIRLPLTLAISQALLVKVGSEHYAVPLGSVEGVTRIPAGDIGEHLRASSPSFEYGDQSYRVRSLSELLSVPGAGGEEDMPPNVPVILVRAGERRTAFVVDGMLGSREIVVKPVGPQVATVPAVAGATIMADGEVVLILDVAALMQMQVRRAMRGAPAEVAQVRDERPLAMVVDDSITIRRVSDRFLSRNGFAVVTAKDGMDALAKLQTHSPDVVLLDIEMPRIDGFELATYMRNSDNLRKTPIIMVTSRSGDKHRRRAEAVGVDGFVTKPYQERDLLEKIHAVMRRSDVSDDDAAGSET